MNDHPTEPAAGAGDAQSVLSRRRFLLLAGQVGALFAVGGAIAWQRQARFIRPPGAGDEIDFLAQCSACNRCVEICPQDVLARVRSSEDFGSVGTPRLSFQDSYCDFCGACIDACPTGALSATSPRAAVIGVAAVERDKCIAWNWGDCNRCVPACPEGAIGVDENGRPSVDAARCTGCGACEAACDRSSKRLDLDHSGKGIVVHPLTATS